MSFDYDRPFLGQDAMSLYMAVDPTASARYGSIVKAMELSNREYQHRYNKLAITNHMKAPPSSNRIFSGYLVVRKLGSPDQYETWMPNHVFDDLYRRVS
ncbi:hypothetical protein D9M69_608230 [compost metagenome]